MAALVGCLKKEMGLQHVSGDYNHRKQEHNCLQYTNSRKCTTGEGQEDAERAREMDGTEHERERERDLLMKHQELRWRQRRDETGTFFFTLYPGYSVY